MLMTLQSMMFFLRVSGVVEVRQVVNDVLGCGGGVPFCSHGQVFTKMQTNSP